MRLISVGLLAIVACSRSAPPPNPTATAPAEEPPVALNAEPAVQYPPDLYERGIEGDVVLRLYADSTGRLSPDSTRVSESSGSAGLDSAAVRGVSRLRYAPARRNGLPVSTAFLQTVQFRHAAGAAALNRGPTTPVAAPPRSDSSASTRRPARPAPDTTAVRRATAPRPDTTVAPPVQAKPTAPDTTRPAAPDTTRPDTTRAQPDSNDVQH